MEKSAIFERRVWIDPDPRQSAGIRAARCEELERKGFSRVPFDAAGWMAAARIFSGASPPVVEWSVLPTLDARVEAAIKAWALTAALVPDATWDQLEAIRRDPSFPEIGRTLTQHWHLQLLLDWVEFRTNSNAVSGDGRVLDLPRGLVDELIVEQRRRDRAGPGVPLEQRARQLLLRQLDPERPNGSWALLKWELKRASHEVVLAPERAEALLGSFEGTAVEELALDVLGAELERQRAGAILRGHEPSSAALIRYDQQRGTGSHVEIGRLGFGGGSLYVKSLLYAVCITAVVALLFAVLANAIEQPLVRVRIALNIRIPRVMASAAKK